MTNPSNITLTIGKETVTLTPEAGSVAVLQVWDYEDKLALYNNIKNQIAPPSGALLLDTTMGNLEIMNYDSFVRSKGHEEYKRQFEVIRGVMQLRKSMLRSNGMSRLDEFHTKFPDRVGEIPAIVIFVVEPMYGSYFVGGFSGNLREYASLGLYWVVPTAGFDQLEYCVGSKNRYMQVSDFSHQILEWK